MYFISLFIGLLIVGIALVLIRREFNRAIHSQSQLLEQAHFYKNEDLFELLESLQLSIDEMNRAFYEIASDLEEKYSLHEKEIELLQDAIEKTKQKAIQFHEIRGNLDMMDQSQPPISVPHFSENSKKEEENSEIVKNLPQDKDSVRYQKTIQNEKESASIGDEHAALRARAVALRSEGKSLQQIAKTLGIGYGELQLLLLIRK